MKLKGANLGGVIVDGLTKFKDALLQGVDLSGLSGFDLADRAGALTGDRLVEVDGVPMEGATYDAAQRALAGAPGAERRVVLERAGEELETVLVAIPFL